MENNLSQESGNVGRLLKPFSDLAVNLLLNLLAEIVVQVGQPYASHEVLIAVAQRCYVFIGTILKLVNYIEQKVIN